MTEHKYQNYNQVEHIFRFAAWSASTAAGSSPLCRFKVEIGAKTLKISDCENLCKGINMLPDENFDYWHKQKCLEIKKNAISLLEENNQSEKAENFSDGIAAKLLNCFLKTVFIVQFEDNLSSTNKNKIGVIHPPIDRILLKGIIENLKILYDETQIEKKKNFWKKDIKLSWSTYTYKEYNKVIQEIKTIQNRRDKPLWDIEWCWKGYQ
jgi:hypothetical protein